MGGGLMFTGEQVPAPFSLGSLLDGWSFEPLVIVPVVVIGLLYLMGYARVRQQARPVFPAYRAGMFLASLALAVIAVDGPFDTYSDVDLATHMGQHLVLLYLVAPLAVLGAPVTVALRALSAQDRSRFLLPVLHSRTAYVLTRPWVVGILYAVDLIGTHFTAWYNLSLYHAHVHELEHLSYLVVGILFWGVVLGVEPIHPRPSPPQRIMLVVLIMPVMVIISLVFILATHPLYPYYPALPAPWGGRAFAMQTQAAAGAIMWIPSGLFTLGAVLYIAVHWFRQEEAKQLRLETLQDEHERSHTS
ncbi:MAG TPA: cytochrome c oxidase assembly protein [Nocardioidaceae bacterium]|nr:cytochrome c oxidase assembly protein [Nocardioidaceae bacterium]